MNKGKLRAVMMTNDDNYKSLSSYLGISMVTFSKKINEYEGSEFTQGEISKIISKYDLKPDEVNEIFFA